jgi:hypothetical protein
MDVSVIILYMEYIKRTVEQMLGNIASRKELWMSGTKYQRK